MSNQNLDQTFVEELESVSEKSQKTLSGLRHLRSQYDRSILGFTLEDEKQVLQAMDANPELTPERAYRELKRPLVEKLSSATPQNRIDLALSTKLNLAEDENDVFEVLASTPSHQPQLTLNK